MGKDDRANPACAKGVGGQIAARQCCRQPLPAQLLYFPQFARSSLGPRMSERRQMKAKINRDIYEQFGPNPASFLFLKENLSDIL